jgi:hypothetical protein
MLLGPAGSATVNKDDDPVTDTASHYKINANELRVAVAKAEKEKARRKAKVTGTRDKPTPKTRSVRK